MLLLSVITCVVLWLWYYTIFLDRYERKPRKLEFRVLGKDAKPNTKGEQ